MTELKIDPEFRDKVPPMTEQEFRQLEENILSEGRVLHPIAVWNDTIVDGHNRYAIVKKHPEIPFEVKRMTFADRYSAIVWICKNQLGRRNLTEEQKQYLIGKQYEAAKKAVGAPAGNQNNGGESQSGTTCLIDSGRSRSRNPTSERIAAEVGIGERTVRKCANFAAGVDEAERLAPGAKEKILSGTAHVTKTIVQAIPRMEEKERKTVAHSIVEGKPVQNVPFNPAKAPEKRRPEQEGERDDSDVVSEIALIYTAFIAKIQRVMEIYEEPINRAGIRGKLENSIRWAEATGTEIERSTRK